ncbi:flagellar protein FlaG [Kurthia huakuii]|uniref:flagellar protein FlaG n=1 Tax=Kurthia huakuii TaxID=1421019 RepID=UPI00049702D3|nr:flagellar protein FlaG [Kurthia huakuii]MBM7700753.1 flagellar protein FlaG [Kurthia huakuii]
MKISSDVNLDTLTKSQNSVQQATTQSSISKQIPTNDVNISEMTDENGNPTEQAYQTAVNKLNEFMEYSQKSSKFIFHKDLERYYVEVVDAQSQEVVKEVPPKALLDAYYEMQKLAGKIFDTQA